MDAFQRYEAACRYINEGLIRTGDAPGSDRTRREWMESFLPDLDHPERSFEAIHVAGTSGKGSVATMVAEILHAAGIRAALHVSPYLQVATEKLWAEGRYASAEEFSGLVDWIRPRAEARRGEEVPMHGMASVGLALEFFRRRAVALGVMEAGVGGRSDLTNVMRTRVAVVSALGLDHVKTLGPELRDIAWHKAGVIRAGCVAVVLPSCPEIVDAARGQAREVGAELRLLARDRFGGRVDDRGRTRLTYRGERLALDDVPLGMRGLFQAENAALAVAAVEAAGHGVDPDAVTEGLARARLPGRLELIPPSERNPCPVLLDGAHNPDKLGAMLSGLLTLRRRRLHVVYGAIGSRSPDRELRRLAGLADTLVVTEPAVYQKTARPAEEILQVVRGETRALVERNALDAVAEALGQAEPDDLVAVTGSLYLCGEARERFYPAREVVERRCSWW
jgi:dihydrofolate synthase/folylpolyglutamate synthase